MEQTTTLFDLIPAPRECTATGDALEVAAELGVKTCPDFAEECEVFAEELKPQGFGIAINQSDFQIQLERAPESSAQAARPAPDEGYSIEIAPQGIRVKAVQKAGAFYALQTLRQILMGCAQSGGAKFRIPCAKISDSPRFEWRGFMLDTVRSFMPPAFLKKMLDIAALHKLNRFHWHLTDDQGWRIPVGEYPRLIEIGSVAPDLRHQPRDSKIRRDAFYTHGQIREIVDYAAKRHIMVVPEIETPGHASAVLAAYPQLGCTGGPYAVEGRFGIFDDVLCCGADEVFDVFGAVFKTVAGLFPAPYIHIGGDECPHVRWENCPKCRARAKSLGLDSAAQLQSWMTGKMAGIVRRLGKTPIGWDEILDGCEKIPLPEDAVVMSWRGAEGGIRAAKMDRKVIMAPWDGGCYLDYPHLQNEMEPGLHNCTTVRQSYEYSPLPDGFPPERAQAVIGGQGNVWSELLPSPRWAEYMMFPRLCALSEALWLDKPQKDFASFAARLPAHKQRLDALDVLYYKGVLS